MPLAQFRKTGKAAALHWTEARRTARRRSRERPSARSGGGLEPTAVIPGYCDHAPDSRRTQPTLIRTRDCPMADQCDAEPMRASRARSRSLRPEQQSTRPVHRPVRTKATGEASKPGSCFSNVAAGTPAWQSAPAGGRTCRRRQALRSIAGTPQPSAATVARRLPRRACDRHQAAGSKRGARGKGLPFTGRGGDHPTGRVMKHSAVAGSEPRSFYDRFSLSLDLRATSPQQNGLSLPARRLRFWSDRCPNPWRARHAHGHPAFGGWEANGISGFWDASTGELAQ